MQQNIKPIKRSKDLSPLSREHHEGLLSVWKIRQGIKYNVPADRISKFCQWFWDHHLLKHFDKEETLLIQILPSSHVLMQQMFNEHKNIRAQLKVLKKNSDYKQLEQLAQLLNDHIRFEERILFKEIETIADDEQLKQLSMQLVDDKNEAVWEDEFWIKR